MSRILVCAPSAPFQRADADQVAALAAAEFPTIDLIFHPQCFLSAGHFAGSDADRLTALIECANDPDADAVWFARGGYGAMRIAEDALNAMWPAAHRKTYLGYSDSGALLGGLYRRGIGRPVHAPLPADIRRDGGDRAVRRTLAYLADQRSGLEPSLDGTTPAVAFNLMTLAMLCGTPLMPDLTGHVLMIEEVSEHLYAVDRLMFHLSAHLPELAGLRLGRVSQVPDNDRPFGAEPEQIIRYWCDRRSIPFLGAADIGHDAANRIVPFGLVAHRAAA